MTGYNYSVDFLIQPVVTKKYQCNICLQQFTWNTNLNKHKEVTHGEESKHHNSRM